MISIFSYNDYRLFIRDFCAEKRKTNPHFSYRYLSLKLGIRSPGFLSWVVQGKRSISGQLIIKIAQAFKLKTVQAEFFEHLVHYNQAKDADQKQYHYVKLSGFRRGKIAPVTADQYEFYSTWYHAALRELVAICPIDGDHRRTASLLRPSITAAEARDALALLERLRMVRKNSRGIYERCDAVISSMEPRDPDPIRQFQSMCMDLAKAALIRIPREERDISTLTLSIDGKTVGLMREKVSALRSELLEMARQVEGPEVVMQLNVQLFPLSRCIPKGRPA